MERSAAGENPNPAEEGGGMRGGKAPAIDSSFPHGWRAEILAGRPPILPARHFVYPARVEEVEQGALEVLVRPAPRKDSAFSESPPFLATCALGFAGPDLPTGVWACPNPDWMCAVSGGYAYLIDTGEPTRWRQLEFRPVTASWPVTGHSLLIFAGFVSLIAWGRNGMQWQSARLSWDGLRLVSLRGDTLIGLGWDLSADREMEFEVDLRTGAHRGGGYLRGGSGN